jgi:hypothetical protein
VYLNTDDHYVAAMAERSNTDILRYGAADTATHRIDDVSYHKE